MNMSPPLSPSLNTAVPAATSTKGSFALLIDSHRRRQAASRRRLRDYADARADAATTQAQHDPERISQLHRNSFTFRLDRTPLNFIQCVISRQNPRNFPLRAACIDCGTASCDERCGKHGVTPAELGMRTSRRDLRRWVRRGNVAIPHLHRTAAAVFPGRFATPRQRDRLRRLTGTICTCPPAIPRQCRCR